MREFVPSVDRRKRPYHDVVMVAFDIDGSSVNDVHDALASLMPEADMTYRAVDKEGPFAHIDAWWIADDVVGDPTQGLGSAVFCKPGKQREARKLLAEHGLSLD